MVGTSVRYCYVSPIPAKFQVNSVAVMPCADDDFARKHEGMMQELTLYWSGLIGKACLSELRRGLSLGENSTRLRGFMYLIPRLLLLHFF